MADRFGLTLRGPLMWRWKDHIDRKFMRKLTALPKPERPPLPWPRAANVRQELGDKPFCGGCGAKVSQSVLSRALEQLPQTQRPDITTLPGDDAALLTTGGTQQVFSTDTLRALTLDPYLLGQLATIHALGDIWAMGAAPQAATLTVEMPRQSDPLAERCLSEILTAAEAVLSDAGAALVGGHTVYGDTLGVGVSVTGLLDTPALTLAGARPGDALILNKPIGTGVLLSAEMQGEAYGADIAALWSVMAQSQAAASRCLRATGARAMTDVTGFGLLGHLSNICRASGVGAELSLDEVPLLEGALELSARGHRSSLFARNRDAAPHLPRDARHDLLFDPQTCGGLLASVPEAETTVQRLREAGCPAFVIGQIMDGAAISVV